MPGEDIVWNKITDSAKKRFDYDALVAAFDEIGDPVMPENLLFQIIIGLAAGEEEDTIAAKLSSQLTVLGLGVEEDSIQELIEGISPAVTKEVIAAKTALALFQEGNDPMDVLATVSQLL